MNKKNLLHIKLMFKMQYIYIYIFLLKVLWMEAKKFMNFSKPSSYRLLKKQGNM